MKHTFLKIIFASLFGGLVGAVIIQSFHPVFAEQFVLNQPSEQANNIPVQAVAFPSTPNTDNSAANLTPAAEKGVQSVVHITTKFVREEISYDPFMKLFYGEDAYKIRERRGMVTGSGVIVSPEGYIVTNNHVVQDAEEIQVMLNDIKYNGELVGTDPSTDLAVIKITKKQLPYLTFGNSDDLRLGEWVLAIGNPLNLQTTVTAGIVSAKNRNIDLLTSSYNPEEKVFPVESFIQTDAAVNSGNSGGALVNQRGELVGINTAIASGTGFYTGYSFAIPANIVKKVTRDLIEFGVVKRVQLGVNITDNNSEISQLNGLLTTKGVVITGIISGGNAAKSTLKIRDIIVGINQKNVNSTAELQAELAVYKPGDSIKLNIMRGEELKVLDILLD